MEMMERSKEFSAGSPEATSEIFSYPHMPHSPKKKKNKIKNKKRFSDDQIRLLETIFESDNKLDPRKKLQLARDLGLQPRQVAIWFQNRRARWKSKQIEHDYKILRANYDSLAFSFETLKKEKESLLSELQVLNDKLHKKPEDENGSEIKDLKGNTKLFEPAAEAKLSFLQEGLGQKGYMRSQTDHHSSIDNWHSGEEVPKLLNVESCIDGNSSEPPEKLYGGFDSSGLLDPSSSSSHWLNFWV